MRLIDADALKEHKYHSDITHENAVSVAQIDWMPTIQAVPIEVLQEIKQDIDEWYQFPHSSLNWLCYTKLCEIFDKHINNDQFERIWQNTVEEMKRRKICEDILEEAEKWDSETMSGSLLTDDDLRQLIGDGISRCKEREKEQDKVT